MPEGTQSIRQCYLSGWRHGIHYISSSPLEDQIYKLLDEFLLKLDKDRKNFGAHLRVLHRVTDDWWYG